MNGRKRKGITLPEMMVAVMAVSVVILGTGTVLVSGHSSWNRSWAIVNLERDASYAMLRMSHHLRSASAATLQNDGAGILIQQASGVERFFFDRQSQELRYQLGNNDPETVLDRNVLGVQFHIINGTTVEVDLRLRDGNLETQFTSTVLMRNS